MSPGGLVRALEPILREREGAWVGWAGAPDLDLAPFTHEGIEQVPVRLNSDQLAGFYEGFCNGTLWPLYHDALVAPEFHRHWWRPYQQVNSLYAESALRTVGTGEIVWVQDYQLQLVPKMVRDRRPDLAIGFYLHIPFPPLELFARLPWRRDILEGLLGSDVVAFQTRQSALAFARAARRFTDATGTSSELQFRGRHVRVQVAPIAIDSDQFAQMASEPATLAGVGELRAQLGDPTRLVLGVDRLDYTKGIDLRIKAFGSLVERHPAEHYQFLQVAVPSREGVPAYQDMRRQIEEVVGNVNGQLGQLDYVPVQYMYRSLPLEELIRLYVAADVMLVTPLRDGMNLVAKEYVATRTDDTGVLVLSEFAGAAEQLKAALLVNPHDVDAMVETLERAVAMEPRAMRRRMRSLRRIVRNNDVYQWADDCLEALEG
jgi:alpha,alpha-trehalose-phosphate synthase [UDP-forming]